MYGTRISEGYKRRKGYWILIVHSAKFSIYKHFPKFPFAPLLRTQWYEETLLNDASGIEKDRPCFPRLFIDFEVFLLHFLAVSHLSFQNLSLRTFDAHLGLLISLCSKTFKFELTYNTSAVCTL